MLLIVTVTGFRMRFLIAHDFWLSLIIVVHSVIF